MDRPFKRLLALTASAVIGLLGGLTVASPAQAHHTEITGVASCLPSGDYEITWTVHTDNWENRYAKIEALTVKPDKPINGFAVGSIIKPGKEVVGKQTVPGTTTSAELNIVAQWYDRNDQEPKAYDGRTGYAKFADGKDLDGKCRSEPVCVDAADAQFEHVFDGPKGKAGIRLKGRLPLCEGQKQDFLLVSYYAPGASFGTPQYAFDHEVGTITDRVTQVKLDVDIPPCWTQVDLVWGGEKELIDPLTAGGARYGNKKLGSSAAPGNRSSGPQGWYNGAGTEGRQCTTPKATFVSSCDGTVTAHLANEGKYEATFTVQATGFEETVKVPAGQAKDVEVPAGKGKITVIEQGKEVGSYTWTRPEDCPVPSLVATSTCDSFTLQVTNPKGGLPAVTTATYGTQEKKITVAPGATETIVFTPGDETTAKVTFTGLGLELVALYEKPVSCGELPKTGDNTAGYLATGSGLVALGVVIFFLARRRMVALRRMAS